MSLRPKYYIIKDNFGCSSLLHGRQLANFDSELAIGEGFYLPAVANALKGLADTEEKYRVAQSEIDALKKEIIDIAAPVVLTEGRTDAEILLEAWRKRRGGQPPFRIRSCESGGENAGSGNGGAQSLAARLKGVMADHPHPVIGLFDYDETGISAYKLDRNFDETTIGGYPVKRGIHGKVYAACLVAPSFRQECKEYKNLPIEFLFRDEQLETEIDGKKLTLKRIKASTSVGGKKIEFELDDFTHFKNVGDGKRDFAKIIVPTFDADAFDAFDEIFIMIEALIAYDAGHGQ